MNFGAKIQIILHRLQFCKIPLFVWFAYTVITKCERSFFCSFCVIAFIFAKPQKQNFAVAFNKNEMQQYIWKFNFWLFSNFYTWKLTENYSQNVSFELKSIL